MKHAHKKVPLLDRSLLIDTDYLEELARRYYKSEYLSHNHNDLGSWINS